MLLACFDPLGGDGRILGQLLMRSEQGTDEKMGVELPVFVEEARTFLAKDGDERIA